MQRFAPYFYRMDEQREKQVTKKIRQEVENTDERIQAIKEKITVEKIKKRHREILILLVIVALLCAGWVYRTLEHFSSYEVESTSKRTDTGKSSYEQFQGNLLRYSADGAFYTDYDGNVLWNETYEMTTPTYDSCGKYMILYDKGGTEIKILKASGLVKTIETSLPITEANVADTGTVAVLMQEDKVGHIQLYSSRGKTLASGEIHAGNGGYPIAIALSSDAKKMVVSMINLNQGTVKSTLNFYDFGTAGEKSVDNIVATYSYSNRTIPEVDYVAKNRVIAFGNGKIQIFSNGSKPEVQQTIDEKKEIKSIFYNDNYFGYITDAASGKNAADTLYLYTARGRKVFAKDISVSYHLVKMMDNNEILMTDGREAVIYTKYGICKYKDTFQKTLYDILPLDGARNYLFVQNGITKNVKLK